jgi:hypothetical protein
MSGNGKDPFEVLVVEAEADTFDVLSRKPMAPPKASAAAGVATAHFHGFDLQDRPLIAGLAELPGEIVSARTTVPLLQKHIGSEVVVLFERGDAQRPIVVGVLQGSAASPASPSASTQVVSVQADDHGVLLSAEREIVLRCGDASITLTRAGKVLIKGRYILSRSTGYNKIKGGAVDIN